MPVVIPSCPRLRDNLPQASTAEQEKDFAMSRDRDHSSSELPKVDGRTPRGDETYENWLHDFRNALGNTTIAASAARYALDDKSYDDVAISMRQVEEGCERCLRLLRTLP